MIENDRENLRRAQAGIHSPPFGGGGGIVDCVTCHQPWPCEEARAHQRGWIQVYPEGTGPGLSGPGYAVPSEANVVTIARDDLVWLLLELTPKDFEGKMRAANIATTAGINLVEEVDR